MAERDGFLKQIHEAKVACAKTALANPFIYHEGVELHSARAALVLAQKRLDRAQQRWDDLIAPAKGWATDPLATQAGDQQQGEAT